MIPGISGSLLSEDALERASSDFLVPSFDDAGRRRAHRRLRAWHETVRASIGPAAGPRTIFDRIAAPFCAELGYHVIADGGTSRLLRGALHHDGRIAAAMIATAWGQDAASAWTDTVRLGIAHRVRWCLCFTGASVRVVDSVRTYSRRFVEFDLEAAIASDASFRVLWGLLRAGAMRPGDGGAATLLERATALSERHRSSVRASLQRGVNDALAHLTRAFTAAQSDRRSRPRADTLNEALTVVYRVLFLLFAEARGLVPQWHPIYRDGYTIEALRGPIETFPRPRGLWEAMQSIARLAHRGCRIGELQVTAFNGRLFSPSESPLAESARLDDATVRQALLALTTRPGPGGRERIAYGDLGVEQLGGVYEGVLDLEPGAAGRGPQVSNRPRATPPRSDRRKTSGTFYTPRSLTEYLVRRTLAPLVRERPAEQILSLRVLDPAMGSGAFLVAACRYLAAAYEAAARREGGEVDARARPDLRRAIAQRCLYGVDLNPTAVQLGRLSLWLATLAADRPLTFLDHRLRAGNSLIGASVRDLVRPAATRRRRLLSTPLFDDLDFEARIARNISVRDAIASGPAHTLAEIRSKERALAALDTGDATLATWKAACDTWCSRWFTGDHTHARFPAGELIDAVFGRAALPPQVVEPWLARAREAAGRERFFHWELEFPEAFAAASGRPPGFDAVLGNPPWEMLRADRRDPAARERARAATSALTRFARESRTFAWQGEGHTNLYQLFLERMVRLLADGGRLGVVLPAGLATDQGAAPLRRMLLDRTALDSVIGFENRNAIFPIHRSLKFLLLTATKGPSTSAVPCRFGVRIPERLDELPETGDDPGAVPVPRALLQQVSGDDLAIPDVRSRDDVDLLGHLYGCAPALGGADGWHARFGRELNATEDRAQFRPASVATAADLPIVEGKQLTPFACDVASASHRVPIQAAERLLDRQRTFGRARLAYRDVASPTNRLTLIAAIVPAGVVTTHSVFCLKTAIDDAGQAFLCAMLNSYVANYIVRLRVSTHVTTRIVEGLPVPRPARGTRSFRQLAGVARGLARGQPEAGAAAQAQAIAARLYGLDRRQFAHVLSTFPLVPREVRAAAMSAFCDIVT
jgi:N-6 DNA Methylase/Eco57I restriction-modification methylase